MNKALVKLVAGFSSIAGLLLLLTVTVNIAQQNQKLYSEATTEGSDITVKMLSNTNSFDQSKTIVVDFSQVDCCKVLSHEYMNEGVVFDNEINLGWSTYQSNGYVNNLSTSEKDPGAPAGTTGTRMVFNEPASKVGFYLQTGNPYAADSFRVSKPISLKAYDEDNNLVFFESTDTCLSEASSCQAKYFGFEANKNAIKTVEVVINDSSGWSMDDLMFEI